MQAVAVFPNAPQAQRARTILDEAGIDSEIGGMGSADPFAPLMGRRTVMLLVAKDDADAATETLRKEGFSRALDRAKERQEKQDEVHEPTGPQHVRFAGLLVVGMSILLLLSRQDPAAWILIGAGVLLAGFGHAGVMRARRRAEQTE